MSKAHRKMPDTQKVSTQKEMTIRSGDLFPGSCVSCDQWIAGTLGRRGETYGKEPTSERFTGGTIFYDHATQFIFHKPQVSLNVG